MGWQMRSRLDRSVASAEPTTGWQMRSHLDSSVASAEPTTGWQQQRWRQLPSRHSKPTCESSSNGLSLTCTPYQQREQCRYRLTQMGHRRYNKSNISEKIFEEAHFSSFCRQLCADSGHRCVIYSPSSFFIRHEKFFVFRQLLCKTHPSTHVQRNGLTLKCDLFASSDPRAIACVLCN